MESSVNISLIDVGVKSISEAAPFNKKLEILNLHCNHIQEITHLNGLHNLKHLDLSSNKLSSLGGLEELSSLRTLNLSCNILRDLNGIQSLRSLVKLNLSYNQITDISALGAFDKGFKLTELELQGNHIEGLNLLCETLSACTSLRHLHLQKSSATNPVCSHLDYRSHIWRYLQHLSSLDGRDNQGHFVPASTILSDIPGLGNYTEFLISTDSSVEINPIKAATPRIDAALEKFRQMNVSTPEISSTTDLDISKTATEQNAPNELKNFMSSQENRIESIETKLDAILKSKENLKVLTKNENHSRKLMNTAKTAIENSNSSVLSTDCTTSPKVRRKCVKQERGKPERRSARTGSKHGPASSSGRLSASSNSRTSGGTARRRSSSPVSATAADGSESEQMRDLDDPEEPTTDRRDVRTNRYSTTDSWRRDEVKSTYIQLMKELESERERRWKSEQAALKLADHIKELRTKAKEDDNLQDVALQTTAKLKQALTNQKEAALRSQAEKELLEERISELERDLSRLRESEEEGVKALRSAEQTAANREKEVLQQQAHDARRLQTAVARASASQREAELVRAQTETLRAQLQQVQELLVSREQQHKTELDNRYPVDGPEIQKLLQAEAQRAISAQECKLQAQRDKISELSVRYSELEDEFRGALAIESARFSQLQEAYKTLSDERAELKSKLLQSRDAADKSNSMISELTLLVKEQKGRISEFTKSKQELILGYKEQLQANELSLDEARSRLHDYESTKKENTKLSGTIRAQEALIEGLRKERKLWSEELAQQGASLAHDRGHMESKIEGLSNEVIQMKRQLEQSYDSVKIKTKMIEDQTESIKNFKEAVVSKDSEIKTARMEVLQAKKELEAQISSDTNNQISLNQKLERLQEKNATLKEKIHELESELDESQEAHKELSRRWKEKSSLIFQLETQVKKMKTTWENKEKQLVSERDKAIHAANLAIEKLRKTDDVFRQQLESKEESHAMEIRQLENAKELEVQQAYDKVHEVESEMRQLLVENESNKKLTEDKLKKLNQAFSELQDQMF